MDGQLRQRFAMALTGGAAGLACEALVWVTEADLLGERAALGLAVFALVFFAGVLALGGLIGPRRAVPGAGLVAAALAGLLMLAGLRFDAPGDLLHRPIPVLAALVLGFVPLPFVVALLRGNWRDYPVLFTSAWAIVVRYAAAWLFVGVVWLVLFLSDQLLGMVGLPVIGDLLDLRAVSLLVSGLALGLGLAVVGEMAETVAPDLVLRLLRVLVPVLLPVLLLFVIVLPLRGFEAVFAHLSAAATLLAFAALGATLVTAALDQSAAEQSRSAVVMGAARIMAPALLAPAGLAGWAIWLRVAQYGWTPDRLLAAALAVLGMGYGLGYLWAVLRGAGWQDRVRQTNVAMALALLATAALFLTPMLNPERISTASQLARLADGRATLAQLDVPALGDWGRAGQAALAGLEAQARAQGDTALAARLAGASAPETSPEALRAELAGLMPLRPADATAMRDAALNLLWEGELADWAAMCRDGGAPGLPGCVMLVADFWPDRPGPEALALLRAPDGTLRPEAFGSDGSSMALRLSYGVLGGTLPEGAEALALLQSLVAGGEPALAQRSIRVLELPQGALIPLP